MQNYLAIDVAISRVSKMTYVPNKIALEVAAKAREEERAMWWTSGLDGYRFVWRGNGESEYKGRPHDAISYETTAYRDHIVDSACDAAFITAYMASLAEQGLSERCKHFSWSDDGQHKFGTSEYDLPSVLIIKDEP
jgi:hypothetical protein